MNLPIPPTRPVRISGRVLAAIIYGVTAFWYFVVLFHYHLDKSFGDDADFWALWVVCGPFVSLVFLAISWQVYREEHRRHPFLFWGSQLFGLSPLGWLLLLVLAQA